MKVRPQGLRDGVVRVVGARKAMDSLLTEKAFMQQVIAFARCCKWQVYHTHDSRRSAAGFPDLVLVKPGHPVVFWECKREKGKLTFDQQVWLVALKTAEPVVLADVIRPSDWPNIKRLLEGEA